MCEVKLENGVEYSGRSQSRPSEGTNCLKGSCTNCTEAALCTFFMAFSCPRVVLGRLIKEEEREDGENHGLANFHVYTHLATNFSYR